MDTSNYIYIYKELKQMRQEQKAPRPALYFFQSKGNELSLLVLT